MEPCKGLFWWTGERLLCVQFPCGADGNALGDAAPLADWNNHRRAWARLPKDVTQGKVFDYYPRGRVELRRGKAFLFLSPHLCQNEVLEEISERLENWENLKVGQPTGICSYRYIMPKE